MNKFFVILIYAFFSILARIYGKPLNRTLYTAVIVNRTSMQMHCIGAIVTCRAILTSCRCIGRFTFKVGSPPMTYYDFTQFYVSLPQINKQAQYTVVKTFASSACTKSEFDPMVYQHDLGGMLMSEPLYPGTGISVIKGPLLTASPERLQIHFRTFQGSMCTQFFGGATSFTAEPNDVKVLSNEDCVTKKCSNISTDKCQLFKSAVKDGSWACAEDTKGCVESYGSPVVCKGEAIGIASISCKNEVLIFSRIDADVEFLSLIHVLSSAYILKANLKFIAFLLEIIFTAFI